MLTEYGSKLRVLTIRPLSFKVKLAVLPFPPGDSASSLVIRISVVLTETKGLMKGFWMTGNDASLAAVAKLCNCRRLAKISLPAQM